MKKYLLGSERMISNDQQTKFKKMLLNEQNRIEHSLETSKEDRPAFGPGESVTELSLYDNHPGDMATELFDREKDQAIEAHEDNQLQAIHEALAAIENGSYGKCKVCEKDIPFERLEALPYTLYCVEHTPRKNDTEDRTVEEELLPLHGPDFSYPHNPQYDNREDSFEEVAKFGTSETPSDMGRDKDDYTTLYEKNDVPEGFAEEYESFIGNEMDGERRVFPNKAEKDLEQQLDEEQMESQLGDIPYKLGDSYIDKK